MKIINGRAMAQSVLGSNVSLAAQVADPNVGAGWTLFAFSGDMPTSKEGFNEKFNSRSLADLYNNSLGLVRSAVSGVVNGNTISLVQNPQYTPKGVCYYGTIGSALTPARQVLPNRITRSAFTDRNITLLTSKSSAGSASGRFGGNNVDFEFDVATTITHIKYGNNGPTTNFNLVALSDDGLTEYGLGLNTSVAGEPSCYALASPRAAKRYRFKNINGVNTTTALTLLTTVDAASTVAQTKPTWFVLAHCNTFTHGDYDYSDEIMFCAASCGNLGPFNIVGQVMPAERTTLYCPKLRFKPRSN